MKNFTDTELECLSSIAYESLTVRERNAVYNFLKQGVDTAVAQCARDLLENNPQRDYCWAFETAQRMLQPQAPVAASVGLDTQDEGGLVVSAEDSALAKDFGFTLLSEWPADIDRVIPNHNPFNDKVAFIKRMGCPVVFREGLTRKLAVASALYIRNPRKTSSAWFKHGVFDARAYQVADGSWQVIVQYKGERQ